MPVMSASTWRVQNPRELVLKNLAEQLLAEEELRAFKQALQHFRVTHSVPQLCTSLRPLVTGTERLMLLVELAQHMPSELLKGDFQKLCTLQFPKYHTFLRYFSPVPVKDDTKVVTQDASGQYVVTRWPATATAGQVKPFIYPGQANGHKVHVTPAPDRPESGFYSDHEDAAWSRASKITSSATATLHRSSRSAAAARGHPTSGRPWTDHRVQKRSSGPLTPGTPKILSGSFQSLQQQRTKRQPSAESSGPGGATLTPTPGVGDVHVRPAPRHQRRILLARRGDGSLGVGIKGGREYNTPVVVHVVEEGSQALLEGLRVGDRILDVNGTDVTGLTHAEVVTLMRNAWNVIMTVDSHHVISDLHRQGRASSGEGSSVPGGTVQELELVVFRSLEEGKLGCAVHRDSGTGQVQVRSVDRSWPAGRAGLQTGDTIVAIEGIVVKGLSEKQIGALISSKKVRLRILRYVKDVADTVKPRTETVTSDDVFAPLDFSSPVQALSPPTTAASSEAFTFTFPASNSPASRGRTRAAPSTTSISRQDESEDEADGKDSDRSASSDEESEAYLRSSTKSSEGPWRELDPEAFREAEHHAQRVQRVARPRTMAMPSTGLSQAQAQFGNGVVGSHESGLHHVATASGTLTSSRGRTLARSQPSQQQQQQQQQQHPSRHNHHHHHRQHHTVRRHHHHQGRGQGVRYALVYTTDRGRSVETRGRQVTGQTLPGARSRSLSRGVQLRLRGQRSRSRELGTLSPADRDLLQAVQSGMEKRQQAVRLARFELPATDHDNWKI